MFNLWKLAKELFSPGGLWSLAEWVWPAGTATISVALSAIWQLPPSFTLAMAMLSATIALVLVNEIKRASIFKKLSFSNFRPIHILSSPDNVHFIQLGATV